MERGLKSKAVLVLASSKGLGKAIAMEFAKEGANVMITSRNEELLHIAVEEIREETGAHVHAHVCDIKKADQVKELVQKTVEAFGTVDVLVNNSGGPLGGSFDDMDDEKWIDAFELTLLSYIRAIREVLPYMRKQQRGHIVNVASTSFKQPIEGLLLSNTFRTGITGLSKTLSQEFAQDNILINTIGPGKFATDRVIEIDRLQAESKGKGFEQFQQASQKAIPIGRYGDPSEFAKAVVFLSSGANTYITGQAILVDGGATKAL